MSSLLPVSRGSTPGNRRTSLCRYLRKDCSVPGVIRDTFQFVTPCRLGSHQGVTFYTHFRISSQFFVFLYVVPGKDQRFLGQSCHWTSPDL